jgi:hypothetical protein
VISRRAPIIEHVVDVLFGQHNWWRLRSCAGQSLPLRGARQLLRYAAKPLLVAVDDGVVRRMP